MIVLHTLGVILCVASCFFVFHYILPRSSVCRACVVPTTILATVANDGGCTYRTSIKSPCQRGSHYACHSCETAQRQWTGAGANSDADAEEEGDDANTDATPRNAMRHASSLHFSTEITTYQKMMQTDTSSMSQRMETMMPKTKTTKKI